MLDAAVSVFSRRGYHAASMDEIAEVAGISKPMVYAYLGAKEELFAACLRRESDRLVAAVAGVAAERAGLSPEELLWRGLRAFFRFVHANRDGWAVLHRRARGEDRAIGKELGDIRERVVDVVSVLLADAKAVHGSQRTAGTDADLRAFAHALVGAAESLAGWVVDHPDEPPDATASRLMNLVWVGFDDLLRGEVWRPAGTAIRA